MPPRGDDPILQNRIDMFNTYIETRGLHCDNVVSIAAYPTRAEHYKYDLVHFNSAGSEVYTNNLVNAIFTLDSFYKSGAGQTG